MKIREDFFVKYGIMNSEIIDLKDFNIIIGKNGAGKTRLLKALRDGLSYGNMSIIYAYFPDMHANFGMGISEEEYEIPLYEMIFEGESIELGNFIQYIEQHGYDFLIELLRDIDKYSRYKKSVRKERAERIRDDLNVLLEILIGRHLKFESEIIVKSSIYESEKNLKDDLKQMSPGELALFYLCILLIIIKYNKDDSKKLVVLLDEPELHLHPKALISFIDYLKSEEAVEMCCIATHSIFLIPLFDFYEIIHIERGVVQTYNSKLYNAIFENIVGKNELLNDFLISRDTWKYYQFIAECFYLPTIVEKVSVKDEQFLKFLSYIKSLGKSKKNITILDYGAGGGRLGKTINYMGESENYIRRKIKYFYYDRYHEKPADLECEAFRSIDEIQVQNRKFNCVILMNVLHEIDIKEWKKTFSDIYTILEDNGYLLIFEVVTLLHGEQPYGDNGYILLGEEQIRKLFMESNINMVSLKDNDKTRMFIIPKTLVMFVTENSILKALKSLKESLFNELREYYLLRKGIAHRKEKVSQKVIKDYGFLSQHYLNSVFAIESLYPKGKITEDKKSIAIAIDVDALMLEIGKYSSSDTLDTLRRKLLEFKTDDDKKIIKDYLIKGNYQQRKSARYYLYNVNN